MKPIKVYDATVTMDYGQFFLYSKLQNCNLDDLIDKASKGENIAGNDEVVLLLVPHQHNFAMPLRVELWNDKPPSDIDNWEEVFEGYLNIVNGILVYDSPDTDGYEFEIPNNQYKVLISGRGFVNRGWTKSTEPGDNWRVQLWPSQSPPTFRSLKKWTNVEL